MSAPRVDISTHIRSIAENVEQRFKTGRRVLSFAEYLELFATDRNTRTLWSGLVCYAHDHADEADDIDDQLSFRRPGIGTDVTRKLRMGHWSIQRQLDLHGLRRDEAREALGQFIRLAHRTGLRCVRIVHGKGLGSPGKTPVLKGRVQGWLVQKSEVLAFVQARPAQGGAGALVVLLAPAPPRASGRPPSATASRRAARSSPSRRE